MKINVRSCVINARFYQIPYVFVESGALIDAALGQYNRKSVAIVDAGFAKSIQSCMKG